MRLPVIQGIIDRRILVNYRVRPKFIQAILPPPFRAKEVAGWAMAGICLIRLKQLRPRHLPAALGIGSENAAHRIAVQWDMDGRTHEGVYIARRDSSSVLNTLAGGRLFPGVHHHAHFDVQESPNQLRVEVRSKDGVVHMKVEATIASSLTEGSIFSSIEEASAFFEAGRVGYSPALDEGSFDGLELQSHAWRVQPLQVQRVQSSFFADRQRFPAGSVEFDDALLMRGIEHEWHDRGRMPGGRSVVKRA